MLLSARVSQPFYLLQSVRQVEILHQHLLSMDRIYVRRGIVHAGELILAIDPERCSADGGLGALPMLSLLKLYCLTAQRCYAGKCIGKLDLCGCFLSFLL